VQICRNPDILLTFFFSYNNILEKTQKLHKQKIPTKYNFFCLTGFLIFKKVNNKIFKKQK